MENTDVKKCARILHEILETAEMAEKRSEPKITWYILLMNSIVNMLLMKKLGLKQV